MPPMDLSPISLRLEGDLAQAKGYLPHAKHLLFGLQEKLKSGGVQSGAAALRLSDTAYCYARIAMGVTLVRVVCAPGVAETVYAPPPTVDAWDFLSGLVLTGEITEDPTGTFNVLHRYRSTAGTRQRFAPKDRTRPQLVAEGLKTNARLAVRPNPDIAAEIESARRFSQHFYIRPTYYSGTMRKVVQIVLGYGRLPERSRFYRRRDRLSAAERAGEVEAIPTRYLGEVAQTGVQVRYDYRAYRTHGATQANDGTWWLVEISLTRGIVAMPLPRHPYTRSAEFVALLDEQRDDEALELWRTFGGFPTGESFPTNTVQFEAWKRAGRILSLATRDVLNPFYHKTPYSSALGWAFNARGDEAHNTCWDFDTDSWQTGYHYAIRIKIGALPAKTDPAPWREAFHSAIDSVARMSDQKIRPPQFENRADACRWKIDYLTPGQADQVQAAGANGGALALFLALDNLQLDLVEASASFSKAGSGRLYNPGKHPSYQIKFWEPQWGLISHDWGSEHGGTGGAPPVSDTTMLVFFAGNELKWVRYFYDARLTNPGTHATDDDEDCMYVGNWTRVTKTDPTVGRFFYTSDIDDRAEHANLYQETRIASRDLGWCTVGMADDPSDFRRGVAYRTRRFHRTTDRIGWTSQAFVSAIVAPEHDREAYYYALAETRLWEYVSHSETLPTLGDPNGGTYWRRLAAVGGWAGVDIIPECGNSTSRRIVEVTYSPYPCSDFADQGPWLSKCMIVEPLCYTIPPPTLPPATNSSTPLAGSIRVELVCSGEPYRVLVYQRGLPDPTGDYTHNLWFLPSPDEAGNFHHIRTTGNCFGPSACRYYEECLNGSSLNRKIIGTPNLPEMLVEGFTFIGVA